MLHPHVQVDDPWLDAEDHEEAQDWQEPEDEGEQPTLRFQVPRAFQPLLKHARYKAARGGRGSGKCLGKGTLVIMHDGSRRPVEEIRVGDLLRGPDGQPRTVLSTTHGHGLLYQVKQRVAEDYIVNGDHILALIRYKSRGGRKVLVTAKDFAKNTKKFRLTSMGYKAGVIPFGYRGVPLDPYFLGLWLGDGDAVRPAITSMDNEVILFVREFGANKGYVVHECKNPKGRAVSLVITNNFKRSGSLKEIMRSLRLFDAKRIPQEYISNHESVRLQVLAGLIDSDGHYANGCYTISQVREDLARDIKYLADSLGFKTSIRIKQTHYLKHGIRVRCKPAWIVSISGNAERIPCRIPRKQCPVTSPNKDWLKTAIDVVPIGDGEYFGFELDSDHLFLLGDGTVTHNSHRFAEQLIDKAIRKYEVTGGEEGLRWACLREVQKSLEQSAMRLIKDKVLKYGLTDLFDISKKDVIIPPGKEGVIIFQGMQNHTADSIKSLEGYDGGWVEEAHRISEYSLSLLRPTFRKDSDPKTGFEGSELWFSYNPEDPKDPIDKFFFGEESKIRRDPKNPSLLISLPFNSIVIEANWYDNPWLPQVLAQEKDYDKRRDPDRYAHVWLGKYKRFSEARVFRNWKIAELPDPPADVRLYFGADWGYSVDPTVLVRLWVDQEHRRIYIDHEAYQVGCEINNIPALFEKVPGSRDWPIRADSSRPDTISYVGNVGGFQITPALKGPSSVEDGIEFMKSYDIVVDPRCKHVIDELSYYSWKVDKKTEEILPVLEDKNNHVIDSARYALESVRGGVSMMDYL